MILSIAKFRLAIKITPESYFRGNCIFAKYQLYYRKETWWRNVGGIYGEKGCDWNSGFWRFEAE